MKRRHHASLVAFLALLLTLATGAAAWEYAYGPPTTREQAFRRVSPVLHCNAPGYIAVGTLDNGVDSQVYVVFSDPTGGPVWEFAYDGQGVGLRDEGVALVELPNGGGFVILSNTEIGGAWSPVLTRISCGGAPLWSFAYPDELHGNDLRGRDLIRTVIGSFVIAGYWWNGSDEDAFLLRTTAAGAILWNRAYDAGGFEAFHAVTEAYAPNSLAPNLVAVGRFNQAGGDLQGLVARVSGVTGGIGALPQCMAQHGSATSDEVYNSVTDLTDPIYAGEFAMVGTTTSPATLSDIWLSRGNPCNLAAQSRMGNWFGPPTSDEGYDVIESVGPLLGPVGPVLAVVGAHGPTLAGPFDASFLQVYTGNLMVVNSFGHLFGDHAGANEVFYSLAQDPPPTSPLGTYIAAGYTATAWQPGDPRDLYLVRIDPTIFGGSCHEQWEPNGVVVDFPSSPIQPEILEPAGQVSLEPQWFDLGTAFQICP